MSDAESYVSDHIAGRDLWVAMKAWSERLSGKQENNGVYFGKNDTLINRVDQPDMDQLEQNLSYVDALTADLSSGLSRLQETLADIQAIFDDAESAFDELQLPGEDEI